MYYKYMNIFENIQEIFEYITGNEPNIILIYPKPQEPTYDGWCNIEDKNDIMLNKMISKIRQFNFTPVKETGFYVKIF